VHKGDDDDDDDDDDVDINTPAQFLGAFSKLRNATISFVVNVCLSVRPSACSNSASD